MIKLAYFPGVASFAVAVEYLWSRSTIGVISVFPKWKSLWKTGLSGLIQHTCPGSHTACSGMYVDCKVRNKGNDKEAVLFDHLDSSFQITKYHAGLLRPLLEVV
ncbi:hypothetical protein BD289DRAFT_239440 [Coniella lustricola]|uniref:Uncharacterized protein n=1 Tax=Coniella lustricola TaxID=2025994 RepID=A0A2T3AL76_9PEZI|nr:hypothetical protein BD289DRAFT_239440 [Coniella lustricola]